MLLAVIPTSSHPSLPASSSASRSLRLAGTLLRSILLYSHWGILNLHACAFRLDRLARVNGLWVVQSTDQRKLRDVIKVRPSSQGRFARAHMAACAGTNRRASRTNAAPVPCAPWDERGHALRSRIGACAGEA